MYAITSEESPVIRAQPNHEPLPYTRRMVRLAVSALIAVAVLATPALSGQDPPEEVDQLFAAYGPAGNPGCSLGVIRDGRFLYRKSYGEASLELGVPITPESVFYVGSVSKQFTATSILLAAEQGRLSLDDNLRKYIPELPDYGHVITLRQMLNQTSGLRDFFDLIYFSGRDLTEFNSPGEILKLIERQKGLNNLPGAEWVYSNTNYFLLGIALQRATGKTLAEFAAANIFRPLGMAHTRFYDDASVVVPGRVAGYDSGPDGRYLVDWSTTYAIVGGGGLITTVDDLLLWDDNFYANKLGTDGLTKELETTRHFERRTQGSLWHGTHPRKLPRSSYRRAQRLHVRVPRRSTSIPGPEVLRGLPLQCFECKSRGKVPRDCRHLSEIRNASWLDFHFGS